MNVHLRKNAFFLIGAVFFLSFYGLLVIFSSTHHLPKPFEYVQKQAVWLVLSFFGLIFFARVETGKLKKFVFPIALTSLFLLAIVLIPGIGVKINGARRWLNLIILRLQVSELAKLGFLLAISKYLYKNQESIRSFTKGFFIPCLIIGIFCLLILAEPDFGTAFLFGGVGFCLLFASGVSLRQLITAVLLALLLFCIAIYLNPVRLKRVTSFLDLEANKLGGSYQLWQSLIGIGSGGFFGEGIGNGRQQHFFLPEAHTDFIFSILSEELGLLHALIVLALFLLIAMVGFKIIANSPDLFRFCIAFGALSFILIQAFLNLGVVIGLLPTKGIALPFISYGGSNLFANFCLIGLLLRCDKEHQVLQKTDIEI